MSRDQDDIRALDACFEAARAAPLEPSPELLARVLADADAEYARTAMPPARVQPLPRAGRLGQAIRTLGGWPAMGGLAAATVAGIWIGLSPPEGVQAYLSQPDAAYIVDLPPGVGFDLTEGTL